MSRFDHFLTTHYAQWDLRKNNKNCNTLPLKKVGWSHPCGRISNTCMVFSILWQLRELLDKTVDIVPVFLYLDTRIRLCFENLISS